MTITNLSEVADRVEREVREAMRMPTLDAARAILNEAGIRRSRRDLAEAPDRLAEAQTAFREAQGREALARESYAQALLEAEWSLDDRFKVDGNKTYLRLPCEACGGEGKTERTATPAEVDVGCELGVAYDKCVTCDGLGTTRKQMTADERKAYKASEAAKAPVVVEAASALRRCEMATAAARDAVGVAEKRLSAAKYDIQAAVAELNALAIGLASRENAR